MDRINKSETLGAAEAISLHADEYDRWFDDPGGSLLFDAEVKAIQNLMKTLSPPFLEIGVGSGRFARALGIEFGIDPSPKLLEMALKRGVKAEKAFGENIPFPNGLIGAVFILFTLCFVKEPAMVLSEAKRVLRNGGGVFLGIINKESQWGKLYQSKKTEGHPIYQHATFYSIEEVEKMIVMAGLQIASYSSTLYQSPKGPYYRETASFEKGRDAGFVCILAKKP